MIKLPERYSEVKFNYTRLGQLKLSQQDKENLQKIQSTFKNLTKDYKQSIAGNVSCLSKEGFLVSTTGSELDKLKIGSNFSKVTFYSTEKNINFFGEKLPSSESYMHLLIYQKRPDIIFIFHLHLPNLEQIQLRNFYPISKATFPYGTPEFARETMRSLGDEELVILKSHGIVIVSSNLLAIQRKIKQLLRF